MWDLRSITQLENRIAPRIPVPELLLFTLSVFYLLIRVCMYVCTENLKTSVDFHILLHLYFLGVTVNIT